MDAYIYRGAWYCADCASDKSAGNCRPDLYCECENHAIDACDSECCSQGPYVDGGGEADSPSVCSGCGLFLENPLTSDGVDYLLSLDNSSEELAEQLDYYGFHDRAEVMRDYVVRRGVIQSPGKMEGEPLYAPFFYGLMMEGCADETIYMGEGSDDTVDVFKLSPNETSQFPELSDVEYILCSEDNSGFFYARQATAAEVDQLRAEAESNDSDSDSDF